MLLRRVMVLLFISLLPLTAAGCWNRVEVNDLVINTALGLDWIELNGQGAFCTTMLVMNPAGAGGTEGGAGPMQPAKTATGHIITATGSTIYEALRDWTTRSSRRFFAGHVMVIVVGEELARDGITEFIDITMRHREIRERTWVVVCEGRAQDVLQAQPEFESLISTEIDRIITKGTRLGSRAPRTDLHQVAHDLLTPGQDVVVPRLTTLKPPEVGFSLPQAPGTSPGPQQKTVRVSGAAAFSGDRLAGWMNQAEVEGMLFINNQAENGIITVAFDSPDKNASYLLRGARARVQPRLTQDGMVMQVRIRERASYRSRLTPLFV